MARVPKPRDIIDRKALAGDLALSGGGAAARPRAVELFKAALTAGRAEIRRRFETAAAPGSEVVHANAYLIDQLVRGLYDFTLEHVTPKANPAKGEPLTIAATGGYGRGELAPYSDIDLLFLLPNKQTPDGEQIIETLLYTLWDLGLKVGHAARSVAECIRLSGDDLTIRTSLLEARWLCGDVKLFGQLESRFAREVVASTGPDFVEAKMAERDRRHARMGDTRYVLEPNVKEGKGGLRDLQTLFWIAKYLYPVTDMGGLVEHGVLTNEDVRHFARAENFLWTVRAHLHYLAGRLEERLTFDAQTVIGARLGYRDHAGTRGVERFMKHYYLTAKDVGDLTRVLCAVLEERHKKRHTFFRLPNFLIAKGRVDGFRVDGDRLTVESDDAFAAEPGKLIRLFYEAQRHGLDIHPQALRLASQSLGLIDGALRADAEANRLFMEILTSPKDPETALRRLNEAGVFGRFIPDFGRVVAQMQYDMYHVYTVDEHTIRAIGILAAIERGTLTDDHPVSSAVVHQVQSRRVLYLALFLHDIAKGRGGDHSVLGAEIAVRMGARMGFSEWETETVEWLVRHHLLMSATAFKRDLEDAKTISDFIAVVQSPERLRLLLVLTVADIRAVGPGVWNEWKATLLRELYYRAVEEMTGGLPAERRQARVEAAQDALRQRLSDWPRATIDEHIERGYPAYWLSVDTDTHVRHAVAVREAERRALDTHIETRVDPTGDVTEILIYTADHPGLFAKIAGAMALTGAAIVDAKIVTLSNGMALDTFSIQDSRGGAFANAERLKKMWKRIEDALAGHLQPDRELDLVRRRAWPSRTRVFKVPPRVLIDNRASTGHTVIEVNGRDRAGFLFDVTSALTELGLQIASAHISTYGERVVDVFYVKDVFGLKMEHEERLKHIRERLIEAVSEAPAPDAQAAE